MLLSISYAGFVVSFILVFFLNKTNRANKYVIIFFLINSLYGVTHHSIMYSKLPILVAILFINFIPLYVMSGPSLFFYFRTTFNGGDPKLRRWDYLHFLPAFVLFLNVLPHLLTSFEYKLDLANKVLYNTTNAIRVIHPIISTKLSFAFIPIQGLLYTIACSFIYVRHLKKQDLSLISPFKLKCNGNWHLVFLTSSFILYFSYSVFTLFFLAFGAEAFKIDLVIILLDISIVFLFFLNFSILLFPMELYGVQFFVNHIKELDQNQLKIKNDGQCALKVIVFSLAPSRLLIIKDAVDEYLLLDPCIRPGFNLGQMSLELQIPKHQLTYFFNDHLKITFNDWKNKIRIAHFIRLLKNGQAINNTQESLSQSSGFLSRSKFTNAFKKSQGKTPSAFIKDLILD